MILYNNRKDKAGEKPQSPATQKIMKHWKTKEDNKKLKDNKNKDNRKYWIRDVDGKLVPYKTKPNPYGKLR
jgi:hypothetical protein